MNKTLAAIFISIISNSVYAYCDGGYPNISVAEELKKSEFVIIGSTSSRKILVDPIENPQGYEAEIFQVKVERVLSGKPKEYVTKEYLTIYNYNASSRFPMELGKKYLLFVSEGADGYWVNSCGNSNEIEQSQNTVELIKKINTAPKK
jgi:hypothetical protein